MKPHHPALDKKNRRITTPMNRAEGLAQIRAYLETHPEATRLATLHYLHNSLKIHPDTARKWLAQVADEVQRQAQEE